MINRAKHFVHKMKTKFFHNNAKTQHTYHIETEWLGKSTIPARRLPTSTSLKGGCTENKSKQGNSILHAEDCEQLLIKKCKYHWIKITLSPCILHNSSACFNTKEVCSTTEKSVHMYQIALYTMYTVCPLNERNILYLVVVLYTEWQSLLFMLFILLAMDTS